MEWKSSIFQEKVFASGSVVKTREGLVRLGQVLGPRDEYSYFVRWLDNSEIDWSYSSSLESAGPLYDLAAEG